jgi:hypothetical protein
MTNRFIVISIFAFFLSPAFSIVTHECLSTINNIHDETVVTPYLEGILRRIDNDVEFKKTLESNSIELDKFSNEYVNCAGILMKRGQFKAIDKIIDILAKFGINISDKLRIIGTQVKKEVDYLLSKSLTKRPVITLTPVFLWAQNRNNLIMQVKFGIRHEGPACLNAHNISVEFEDYRVHVTGDCDYGIQPIKYDLDLHLLEQVNITQCSWAKESVGKFFLNMTKIAPVVWDRLLNSSSTKMPEMRIWWDMKNNPQYARDMDKVTGIHELVEDKEYCAGKKKCREKTDKLKSGVTADNVIINGLRADNEDLARFFGRG